MGKGAIKEEKLGLKFNMIEKPSLLTSAASTITEPYVGQLASTQLEQPNNRKSLTFRFLPDMVPI